MEHRTTNKISVWIGLATIALLQACYYDVGEELYQGACDTTNMSYATDIVEILTNNQCIGCHSAVSPGGSVRLDDYTNVKIHVDNGGLLGSIKHDFGFNPMPKGQTNKIDPCDLDRIRTWINAGALDN